MKCSCVWLVVTVGAHNFHVECGSLGGTGVPYIYIYRYVICMMLLPLGTFRILRVVRALPRGFALRTMLEPLIQAPWDGGFHIWTNQNCFPRRVACLSACLHMFFNKDADIDMDVDMEIDRRRYRWFRVTGCFWLEEDLGSKNSSALYMGGDSVRTTLGQTFNPAFWGSLYFASGSIRRDMIPRCAGFCSTRSCSPQGVEGSTGIAGSCA